MKKPLLTALAVISLLAITACASSSGVTSLGDGKIAVSRNKVTVIAIPGYGFVGIQSNIAPKVINCNVEKSKHCDSS